MQDYKYKNKWLKMGFSFAAILISRMHDLIVEKDPDRVVFEIGSLVGWISDIVRTLGKELEVANTTHDAWRWQNVKKKTDRDDTLKLARLLAMDQIPKVLKFG